MPFIQQAISPVNLSQPNTASERYRDRGDSGDEFDYIVNYTLTNVLRQLASVLAVADGIFKNLNHELTSIRNRSNKVKQKIEDVDKAFEEYDLEMLRKLYYYYYYFYHYYYIGHYTYLLLLTKKEKKKRIN